LPLIPWFDDRPKFHVISLAEHEGAVRSYFSVKHVRYVGSEESCGCAFNYGREYPDHEDNPEELQVAQRSRTKLVEYIKHHRVAEMFACQEGDQGKPPQFKESMLPDDILDDEFVFVEGRLMQLLKND
jgi:hypothetical protein